METTATQDDYRNEPLGPQTWDAFAALAERHNGVWGGCRCAHFHVFPDPPGRKELGQLGSVEELPDIQHRREWERTVTQRPDYRITCLFVDRDYRRAGVAARAVQGALELIAGQGGGRVEAYPHDLPAGKKTSSSFLYNAPRTMYERLGFAYDRPKGRGNCVMTTTVPAT